MQAHKKKPRQRHRPKNKVNQLKNTFNEVDVKNCSDVGEKALEADLVECVNLPVGQGVCDITSAPSAAPSTKAEAKMSFDSNEAIRIIQQLLRRKFLKANQDNQGDKKDANVKQHAKRSPSACSSGIGKSKSKDKIEEHIAEKLSLQRKLESVAKTNAGIADLPHTLLGNLQKLINQEPIGDVETSDDDEEEYIEYIYKPRTYFLVSLCNFCKMDLCRLKALPCSRCQLTFYCTAEHMRNDEAHRQLCYGLRQVSEGYGGHIFYKCGEFSPDQFRSYRIVSIRKVESAINRTLTADERETILFPRICQHPQCREYRFDKLKDCENCGQVAFCKDKVDHFNKEQHKLWCRHFQLFKQFVINQQKFGRVDPILPTKVLRDLPTACTNTKQILTKLSSDIGNACEYAALSQIATAPLTSWYALKLCDSLRKSEVVTIHLIGAEIEFEVDILHKWELFFLHTTPAVSKLNVIFIGPELNPHNNISFDQLKKTKCCCSCRKNGRSVKYDFKNELYHDYCKAADFTTPDLICFFNAGLYRSTGFQLEDTWPETICAAANLKCPLLITSYTEYEAPMDMTRFLEESNRCLNVVLPPTMNPFASVKPERNFISEEDAPLMFKNYYCFVLE